VAALDTTLTDEVSRKRLGIGSQEHAEQFTWNATARATLAVLAAETAQPARAPRAIATNRDVISGCAFRWRSHRRHSCRA